MTQSREIRLKSRPVGLPAPEHFEMAITTLPEPGQGEVLVRNLFMSVDPYMRGRMYDRPSYVPPFAVGAPLEGGAIGEVVQSADPSLKPGDHVMSMMGWREAFVAPANTLEKLPQMAGVPTQAWLGVIGMPGLTAYAGLLAIGEPKPGETVFVSGAAGAVGSIVAQIAKIKGCTVVASAGTDAKCEWLKSLGIDHVINYRSCGNLLEAVHKAAPKGIDVYFDNVGGEHLEVAIELARPFARLVECGMISGYNATEAEPGPKNIIMIVGKSIRMQGFIVTNYAHMRPQFIADMSGWIAEGRIKWEETIVDGLEKAPEAFIGLFSGSNMGKMLVRV